MQWPPPSREHAATLVTRQRTKVKWEQQLAASRGASAGEYVHLSVGTGAPASVVVSGRARAEVEVGVRACVRVKVRVKVGVRVGVGVRVITSVRGAVDGVAVLRQGWISQEAAVGSQLRHRRKL